MCELSIIVPLYNGKKYIKENIDTLLNIKCSKEIIIVDDESSDGSFEYCKELYADISDVRVMQKENGGVASSRNYGLKNANGNYVMFVDQDDIVVEKVIDEAIDIIDENDCDALFWSTEFKYNDRIQKCDEVYKNVLVDRDEIISEILPAMLYIRPCEYASYFGHIWGGIFCRKTIQEHEINFKHFIHYEDDYLFVLDLLLNANRIYMFKETGYFWRQNDTSYSHILKSIPNYFVKSESFFEYVYERYAQICTKEELQELEVFGRQATLIKAMRNACYGEALDKKELLLIKEALKREKYEVAIAEKLRLIGDRRYNMMFFFLKRKLLMPIVLITRIYYLIRNICPI